MEDFFKNKKAPLYHLELKSGKDFTFLNQGDINIGMMGSLGLTEKQVEGINGLLGTLYDLVDSDIFDEQDAKYHREWELKYVEILKARIKVEQEMIKFLEY